jgi:hypothetical protein
VHCRVIWWHLSLVPRPLPVFQCYTGSGLGTRLAAPGGSYYSIIIEMAVEVLDFYAYIILLYLYNGYLVVLIGEI